MLLDSAHIYEEDAQYLNKKKRKHGEPFIEPLYTRSDAERVPGLFREVGYNQTFEPIPGVQARLVDAGHILGSAAVVLDIQEKGKQKRVWFSGDIGRFKLPLIAIRSCRKCGLPDMECTYGDKLTAILTWLMTIPRYVKRRAKRGGKVVIPAFAVGRTAGIGLDLTV